ncbi:MAG: hypothetical protein IKD22_01670 [Lentisphaeria bacterium]|nr:hypothetical protein [Lentisphaeria bacterium]
MKIAGIFLIILSLASPLLHGAVNLPCRVKLIKENSGNDADFLRHTIRRINYFANLAGERINSTRLVIYSNSPRFKVYKSGKNRICMLPGDSRSWRKSPLLRRQMHTALFYARFDLPHHSGMPLLPEWISTGVDEALFSSDHAEQFIAGNRDYSLLREIYRVTGNLPDFTILTAMRPPPGVLYRCFAQQSRLLLEVFSRRKFLRRYLEKYNSGSAADHWLRDFSSAKEAHYIITEYAAALLWNRYSAVPPEKLLARLPELEKTIVPELDKSQAPTGNMPEYDFRQCAAMLRRGGRPDAADICKSFADKIADFARQGTPEVRQLCRQLASAANAFPLRDSAPDEYGALLEQLKKQLTLERQREIFLRKLSHRSLPLRRAYREHFDAIAIQTDLVGNEIMEYLNNFNY